MKHVKRDQVFCILFCLLTMAANGQKIKNKDIRKAIEGNQVADIRIISEDRFTPELKQEFDLQITLQDGSTLLASDHHVIWDHAEVEAINSAVKIKGELLANGKGLLVPHNLPAYYPEGSITLSVELTGKKDSKVLSADYCFSNYIFERHGSNGSSGTSGSNGSTEGNGSKGYEGRPGADGPDLEIQMEEESISGKTFLIIIFEGNKFPFVAECSSISIIAQGGNGGDGGRGGDGGEGRRAENKYTGNGGRGGNGGDGGNGGKGGNIYVFGDAADKYKGKLKFMTEGGKGGRAGTSGRGGNGKTSGSSGSYGRDGGRGKPGEVIYGKR